MTTFAGFAAVSGIELHQLPVLSWRISNRPRFEVC
jgi:hypothetical protein